MQGKHIVIGITGSIAAYKACTLIRLFVKAGAEVQVVITPAGKEFITPVTLSALTGKPVVSEFFTANDGTWHSHVDLGRWADLLLIAPATASTIAKMASGVADNMLLTTYLSMKAPVMLAPAMDLDMFAHPATQRNLETLRRYGHTVIEPAAGELASHLVGKGRMEEPERIFDIVRCFFAENHTFPNNGETSADLRKTSAAEIKISSEEKNSSAEEVFPAVQQAESTALSGRTILITAGPTYEKIDPVRFIGNYSSGKMGFALAEACAIRGADVLLVAGPVSIEAKHPRIRRINVESAAEMHREAVHLFPDCDAAVLCAAVADFTADTTAPEKVKRTADGLTLHLVPTKDIAAELGQMKTPQQRLVGFALETTDELAHAREKLQRKQLDFIVLNSLRDKGAGFRVNTNKVTIVTPTTAEALPLKPKTEVAADIIDRLCELF
ncbi:MAG: bifunctional phosphopantothenoylcysteine decarboxylase/phosphopantothenate synthase [Alloprevotella sp.]